MKKIMGKCSAMLLVILLGLALTGCFANRETVLTIGVY